MLGANCSQTKEARLLHNDQTACPRAGGAS